MTFWMNTGLDLLPNCF